MESDCYSAVGPVIEVMALLDLVSDGELGRLQKRGMLAIGCTSYPEKYATLASERFLVLNFDDITSPGRLYSFRPEHAQAIVRLVREADGDGGAVERIVVACDGGVSRSAAVAEALMLSFGRDDEAEIWADPRYSPNRLVYEVMCEGLGLRMPKAAVDGRVRRSLRVRGYRAGDGGIG